jgi:hypothetical protein
MIVGICKSKKLKAIAAFNACIFKLKKCKKATFEIKKISEWRKLIKKSRRLFRTYEKIYGK